MSEHESEMTTIGIVMLVFSPISYGFLEDWALPILLLIAGTFCLSRGLNRTIRARYRREKRAP